MKEFLKHVTSFIQGTGEVTQGLIEKAASLEDVNAQQAKQIAGLKQQLQMQKEASEKSTIRKDALSKALDACVDARWLAPQEKTAAEERISSDFNFALELLQKAASDESRRVRPVARVEKTASDTGMSGEYRPGMGGVRQSDQVFLKRFAR